MISIDGRKINITKFPDGTSQVWRLIPEMIDPKETQLVKWEFENEGEVIQLVQLKALLDTYGCKSELYMPYLPYGRQDNELGNNNTFALYPFAKIINSLGFKRIAILDPHSPVAKLILNSEFRYPMLSVINILEDSDINTVCYPDAGAAKKYPEVYRDLLKFKTLIGDKTRISLTGEITGIEIKDMAPGDRVLIIDDIYDGGRTFIEITKLLLQAGVESVSLHVSHGLFSQGIDVLKEAGIKTVYTAKGKVY